MANICLSFIQALIRTDDEENLKKAIAETFLSAVSGPDKLEQNLIKLRI